MNTKPQVVILGAGFVGLWAIRELAKQDVDVILIDRNNYHAFPALFYQVATAGIEPEQIAYPIRAILRKYPNVQFRMATVQQVDFDQKQVTTDHETIEYDHLIVGLGTKEHFFGVDGAEQHAFPLKTVEQAMTMRDHLLHCFEMAVQTADPVARKAYLTFTVVGGGPTGVEYAGALRELIAGPLAKDFPTLDINEIEVILVEATDQLLGMFNQKAGDYTAKALHKKGVTVRLRDGVKRVQAHQVTFTNGDVLPTRTVVWTAGVAANQLPAQWELGTAKFGRVPVTKTLQLPEYPNVYFGGDMAYLEQDGQPLPMLAPNAIQQGTHAAQNIIRAINGQAPVAYQYADPGKMATIGRNAAVAKVGNYQFTGFIAWVLWLVIHLTRLVGFRNRAIVFTNWALDYLFYERVARVILTKNQTNLPNPAFGLK